MEIKRLRDYVVAVFESNYEPNSYEDDNLLPCITDMVDSLFIYTEDAEKFVNSFGFTIIQLYLQSKANGNKAIIEVPVKVEDVAKNTVIYFCFEYIHEVLLKAKQKIDKRGW